MKKTVIVVYLLILHALLAVVLTQPDLAARIGGLRALIHSQPPEEAWFIPIVREVHRQMDPSVPAGATLFLGDSITMCLSTAAVTAHGVNYGIGWQRSDQLLESMDLYHSIERAARVVVTIGTNDLLQGRAAGIGSRYRAILAMIPARTEVVLSSIPPLGNTAFPGRQIDADQVREVVASAKSVCAADRRCRFVDAYQALTDQGQPLPGVLLADGIHLAPKGYGLWIDALAGVLASSPSR